MDPTEDMDDQQGTPEDEKTRDEVEKHEEPSPSLFRFMCSVIPLDRVLPGHRHIGLGAGDQGAPVDEDDKIAAQHAADYRAARGRNACAKLWKHVKNVENYLKSKLGVYFKRNYQRIWEEVSRADRGALANFRSWEEVRSADRAALVSFWRDAVYNHNWHSALVLLLLCVKYIAECVLSKPLYPCNLTCISEHQEADTTNCTADVPESPLATSAEPPTFEVSCPPEAPAVNLMDDEEVYAAIDEMRDKIQHVRNYFTTRAMEDPDDFEDEMEDIAWRVQQLEHMVAPQEW